MTSLYNAFKNIQALTNDMMDNVQGLHDMPFMTIRKTKK